MMGGRVRSQLYRSEISLTAHMQVRLAPVLTRQVCAVQGGGSLVVAVDTIDEEFSIGRESVCQAACRGSHVYYQYRTRVLMAAAHSTISIEWIG
jgi:hypothetical protein